MSIEAYSLLKNGNLRCSYCYEHHKSCRAMSRETGERIVDYLIGKAQAAERVRQKMSKEDV